MKTAPLRNSTPHALATPSDLELDARAPAIAAINPLVADAFALYVKTKNYHWHASGSHYRDYHLLLDEQADQIFASIDLLAERVRKLGGLTIHSIGEIDRLKSVEDDDAPFVAPGEFLGKLMEDNKRMAERMRAAHEICDGGGDVATASILETLIDEAERRTWFLFETLQGAGRTN